MLCHWQVKSDNQMHVKKEKDICKFPTDVVANATLLDLPSKEPSYLKYPKRKNQFLIKSFDEITLLQILQARFGFTDNMIMVELELL